MNIKQEVLSDYHFRLSLSNIVAIYEGDGSRVCVAFCRHSSFDRLEIVLGRHLSVKTFP